MTPIMAEVGGARRRGAQGFSRIVDLILLGVCIAGVAVSVRMDCVGRSLWVDEAMLAASFSKRSFLGIVFGGEFEYLQSAPLGWLMVEKGFVKLLGNSEWVLRIPSILSYVASLVILYHLSRYYLGSRHPLFAPAVLANAPLVLSQSNMFKPYMSDCLVALLLCWAFFLWINKGMRTRFLACAWGILMWFSQPASFVVCGFIVTEGVFALLEHNRRKMVRIVMLGIIACASFVLYYTFWVRRMTSVATMREWWEGSYFTLAIGSLQDLKRTACMIGELFSDPFGPLAVTLMAGYGLGIVRAIQSRDKRILGMACSMIVALVASMMSFYPMEGAERLWLFSLPLILLVVVYGVAELGIAAGAGLTTALEVALLCVVLSNTGIMEYAKESNVYVNNEEMGVELSRLEAMMNSGDRVYVLLQAKPAFEYTVGYGSKRFGDGGRVTYGKANFASGLYARWDNLVFKPRGSTADDLKKLFERDEWWIVTSHLDKSLSHALVDPLMSEGHLELASNAYETPLYHWCKNEEDCITNVSLGVSRSADRADVACVTVENIGESFVGNQFGELYLEQRETGKRYRVGEMIAPGGKTSVDIPCAKRTVTYDLVGPTGRVCAEGCVEVPGSSDIQ